MSADTRYDDYFASALAGQPGADTAAKIAMVRRLLAHVESALTGDAHPAEILESERNLARKAAERAIAALAPEMNAPAPQAEPEPAPEAAPAANWIKRAAVALVALIVYLTPLMAFLHESDEHHEVDAHGHDVAIELSIAVADFAKETVTFHVLPTAGALMDKDGRLTKDVTLRIDPGTGPVSHTFKANTHLAAWTLPVYADSGDILEYPFDRYHLEIDVVGLVEGKEVSVQASLDRVPHGLRAELKDIKALGGDADVGIAIRRSGTVIFLALLSTLSVGLVSCAACAVAWQVVYHGRKIEFSMMVWVAALLFVIPAVRNALPGSPPAGALLDFLVFFWLQVAVAVAMISLVTTWVRRTG